MATLSYSSSPPASLTHTFAATSIMSADEPQTFLKMEDLHSSPPPPPPPTSSASSSISTRTHSTSTPPPIVVNSKPAKKRKSWGQELPEPKTTLPPRKRAKTDDEKEQRRIERIKRNRAAAHNSRERKRQETETLAVALARANAELDAYRKLHGPLPANIVLPEVTLCTDGSDTTYGTPAPSLVESHGSLDSAPSPKSPADSVFKHESPIVIKQEPMESSFALSPPVFHLDAKPALQPLDVTQHSAAMLCDLQCPSTRSKSSKAVTPSNSWWTTLFLYLTTLQLQTFYKAILLTIWSTSPSRMAALMQASTLRLTSRLTNSSTTPLLSRSMALAQLNAATRQRTALRRPSMDEVVSARSTDVVVHDHLPSHPHSSSSTSTTCEALQESRGTNPEDNPEGGPGENV